MNGVQISKINYSFDITNILKDFYIIRFTQSEGYIKYGAQFIDELSQNVKAQSVVFESGSTLYTLFAKAEFEKLDLKEIFRNGSEMDGLSYSILKASEIQRCPPHLIIQLLINSLASPKNERLRFNNLTGKLYLFKESLFEKRKFKEDQLVTKIPAIEFKIHRDLRIELRTTTFTSLLLMSKMKFLKKPLKNYSKYTYSHSTKSMRRILNDEKLAAKDVFIIKQEIGKKTTFSFMDFSDLESLEESKVGQLSILDIKIKNKLAKYLKLSFQEENIDNIYRLSNSNQDSVKKLIASKNKELHIANTLGTEGKDYETFLKAQLVVLFPEIGVSSSTKTKKGLANIRLIRNKNYYKENEIEDHYNPSLPITQHITVEDFNFKSNSAIKAVIKELLIKADVYKNHISIVDWEDYGYQKNQTFGIKKNDKFYFLTISPKGSMYFQEKEMSLFNQSEFDNLISIFQSDENIEGIVQNDEGAINIIRRSSLFTIPDFENIYSKLKNENQDETFDIEYIKSSMNEIDIKKVDLKLYNQELDKWPEETISKSQLLSLINKISVKKKLAIEIYETTGKLIKVYMRDKSKYELMDSNLDIHSYQSKGKLFYYVGTIGEGMRTKIGRASVIREISGFENSPLFFDKLLPLMNVDFVKYGDLTVLPFPFKYLREWINLQTITR